MNKSNFTADCLNQVMASVEPSTPSSRHLGRSCITRSYKIVTTEAPSLRTFITEREDRKVKNTILPRHDKVIQGRLSLPFIIHQMQSSLRVIYSLPSLSLSPTKRTKKTSSLYTYIHNHSPPPRRTEALPPFRATGNISAIRNPESATIKSPTTQPTNQASQPPVASREREREDGESSPPLVEAEAEAEGKKKERLKNPIRKSQPH